MAERRMFSKQIIDSDAFLEMPLSTQSLYFHFGMQADDDGFLNSAKKIQRMIGASDDDYKILVAKKFVIVMDEGVCVVKHWKVHNYIPKDRYKPTVYQDLRKKLALKNNNIYTTDTACIQDVDNLDTQDRLGKVRLGKVNNKTPLALLKAEGIPEQLSHDWLQVRKAKKLPLTKTALEATKKQAEKAGKTLEEVIQICCENGWGGFKASYLENSAVNQHRQPSNQSKQQTTEAAYERVFGEQMPTEKDISDEATRV